MTKQEAIDIILSDTKSYKTSLNWTVNYCKQAKELSGQALNIICLYILDNIKGWRHEKAKEVRMVLKRSY